MAAFDGEDEKSLLYDPVSGRPMMAFARAGLIHELAGPPTTIADNKAALMKIIGVLFGSAKMSETVRILTA